MLVCKNENKENVDRVSFKCVRLRHRPEGARSQETGPREYTVA